MTDHTIEYQVSNSAVCSCGETFHGALAIDLDEQVDVHLNNPTDLLTRLITHLGDDEGRLVIVHDPEKEPDQRWMVAYEFGREAPDSDMAGGASYHLSATLTQALLSTAHEVGA